MSADKITLAAFREKLSKYPALIKTFTKPAKDGHLTLEQLDQFRYVEAPSQFSKKAGGKTMELDDVRKLVDWKVRHGTFRPNLQKLVASNKEETVKSVLTEAFAHYSKDPSDIKTAITKISELRGIGPSASSLILAVHDPENVIFFSDEAYRWLCHGGEKVTPKYVTKEFEDLYRKSKELSTKLKISPLDIEKVAFVIIKENEPVYEPKPKKLPSGRPVGRPTLPESEKKPKPVASGRGRGRPAGSGTTKAKAEPKTPNGNGANRGRAAAVRTEEGSSPASTPAKSAKRKAEDDASKSAGDKKVKA